MNVKIAVVASAGDHQRQDHPPEDAATAAAVDPGGLVQLARDAADELHHQEHEERVGGQELRHDQRQERVRSSPGAEQDVLRHDHHVDRQHHGAAA